MTGSASVNLSHSRLQLIKLLFLVALACVIGVLLLSSRQRLLLAAHELATLHHREQRDAQTVLQLRGEIAERVTLSVIRADAASLGVVEPTVDVAWAPPLSKTQVGLDSTTLPRESME